MVLSSQRSRASLVFLRFSVFPVNGELAGCIRPTKWQVWIGRKEGGASMAEKCLASNMAGIVQPACGSAEGAPVALTQNVTVTKEDGEVMQMPDAEAELRFWALFMCFCHVRIVPLSCDTERCPAQFGCGGRGCRICWGLPPTPCENKCMRGRSESD